MQKLRVAFAGTPEFAIPSFESLLASNAIEIVTLFTQPDRPVGRGNILTPPPIKTLAEKNSIPIFQPEKISTADFKKIPSTKVRTDLDFLVVVAFGEILPDKVLKIPRFGCINLHASLLPQFRGASPIQSAILADEQTTGVSFIQISEKLDSGDIFAKFEIPLAEKNSIELSHELAKIGGEKFPEILQKIAANKIFAIPQNEADITFCQKIKKVDGRVAWRTDSAELLKRKLRAFAVWPGVWTNFIGKVLKLIEFEVSNQKFEEKKEGSVFEDTGRIFVATIDGAIELKKVQLAGKQVVPIAEFVRGNVKFISAVLG